MANTTKKKVLFLCTHNSARSQMAEGLLKNMYGDKFDVYSAGTEPSRVNPFAIEAMKEMEIDISQNRSKNMQCFVGTEFDYVVTVCDNARESCPVFPGARNNIHKAFRDPSQFRGKDEEILSGFREVRDEIKSWLEAEFQDY